MGSIAEVFLPDGIADAIFHSRQAKNGCPWSQIRPKATKVIATHLHYQGDHPKDQSFSKEFSAIDISELDWRRDDLARTLASDRAARIGRTGSRATYMTIRRPPEVHVNNLG